VGVRRFVRRSHTNDVVCLGLGISPDPVVSQIVADAEGSPTWWCHRPPGKVADVCRGNRHRVLQRVGLAAFAAAWALPALLGGVVACAGPGWPTAQAAVREQVQPATTSPETTTSSATTTTGETTTGETTTTTEFSQTVSGTFKLSLATNGTGTLAILPTVANKGTVHVVVEVLGYIP